MLPGTIIFLLTYVAISVRRLPVVSLDRPAGALLGAVACVMSGVLTPRRALESVDAATLLLLFGMMGMGAFLAAEGFFERTGDELARRARTPARLLGAIVWGSGILSALITNDAVCVLGAPLVVGLVRRHGLPSLPFVLALPTAANTGSAATLVGNPQNMLCASLGNLDYLEHLKLVGPVAIAGLLVNHLLLWWMFRDRLQGALVDPGRKIETGQGSGLSLAVIAATAGLYTLGADLAWTAAAGLVVRMLLDRRDPAVIWQRIDWSVLVFFTGLFVVVEGFVQSGVPARLFERWPLWSGEGAFAWCRLAGIFLVGSNIVSNVPFILVIRDQMAQLPDPRLGWELLTMASTFAGNLTILGSVANIIVAEKAKDVGGFGFREYFVVGFPLATITTLIGLAWMVGPGRL